MNSMLLKYNSLDPEAQKQVREYIDMLVSKMKKSPKQPSAYKKRILSVSTWSDDDLKVITENHSFNQFRAEEW